MRLPLQRSGATRKGQPQRRPHAGIAPRDVYSDADDLMLDEPDAEEFHAFDESDGDGSEDQDFVDVD